jgi:mannobiose 2-epimerase
MKALDKMRQIQEFTEHDLLHNVLPFWMKHMPDEAYGGFFGRITHDLKVDDKAVKGAVLNARILYTFSAAYRLYADKVYKKTADRAFDYIMHHFLDGSYGGVFWSVDPAGNPADTRKQFYALAFMIYGLAEYYKITSKEQVLREAISIFSIIEGKAFDAEFNGYTEALSREWNPLEDMRLSTKDMNVVKSMNTHLHIMEAYTNLYRVYKDDILLERLKNLFDIFRTHIVGKKHHLLLFFDREWNSMSEVISFGHDIEASWLLHEAAEVTGDARCREDASALAIKIADAVYEGFNEEGGLRYEFEPRHGFKSDLEWWPQAESVVGFLNAYQLTGDEKYLDTALQSCNIIKKYLIDKVHGEWFYRVDQNGKPRKEEDKAGFWKCPYHNGRMAFEVKERGMALTGIG